MKISLTISVDIGRGDKIEPVPESEQEPREVDVGGCADLTPAREYFPLGFTPSIVEAHHARRNL